MQLERTIGLLGLTFVVVSGIIGSGWLFAPFLASQIAGPASIISWFIGGAAILILALCFAETTSILPVAGAIARLPHFTHGDVTSSVLGWSAWVGYNTAAPIETIAMLEYFRQYFPWLFKGETIEGNLTVPGMLVTVTILAFFVVVNAWGVSAFVRANLWITVVKLLVPTVIPVLIIFMHFTPSNFYASEFAPNGMRGVFAAISSGGVIFAFIGFRHAIDLAGEVKRPNFTIPVALTSGLIICVAIYGLLQIAFIGGLDPDEISQGWAGLKIDSNMAPMMGVVAALGLTWVNVMLYTGAIVAPFGGGLVATGSMARLGYALSQNGFFPKWLDKLSSRGVPLRALAMNFVFGVAVVAFISFEEAVAINGAAITISFSAGPLAVVALRKQLPDLSRPFRLPAVHIIAPVSFVVATLIVYWGGWETNWRLGLVIGVGLMLFTIKMVWNRVPVSQLDLPQAIWLIPYGVGLLAFSYLGDFGGGIALLVYPWDTIGVVILSLGVFVTAYRCRLPNEATARYCEKYMAPPPDITPL
ncbi:MAG: APC family permease [Pirellulales bacterium]|nr:APC family permease [Pirellulales bacterium]